MIRRATLGALALAAFAALPTSAQLANFPVTPVPGMSDAPQSWIAGSYGRGLNQASGEENAFGVVYGRTGAPISFLVGAGFVTDAPDTELTLGAALGFHLAQVGVFDVAINGGLGWMKPGDITWLHLPVGVSFSTTSDVGQDSPLGWWFMPRFSFQRWSGDNAAGNSVSDSEFDPGVSTGASFSFAEGFGMNASLDYLLVEGDDPLTLGLGVVYTFPRRN